MSWRSTIRHLELAFPLECYHSLLSDFTVVPTAPFRLFLSSRTLGELSNELKEFIAGHVNSVIRLEVLLLLSEDSDRVWSAEAVDRKLNLTPPSAGAHLDELLSQGLLMSVDEGERYRYHPSSDDLSKIVSQLSNAYATQRVAVLTMIFSNPVDKVRLFTEAFRMIKEECECDGVD